ncbi:MAG: hypothetical protein ACF8R7_12775 [Phycisphaerales bacterium JB039]
MPRRTRLALATAAALTGACAPIGPRVPEPVESEYIEFAPNYPFTPARVDIHPATRLARADDGAAYIRVYLQFRDRWNDNVKTIGAFQIELFAEGAAPVAWDIVNLSDDLTNHQHYDPVTGMYQMDLYNLPAWLEVQIPRESRAAPDPMAEQDVGPVALRVTFTFPGPDGPETLRDDYYLRP